MSSTLLEQVRAALATVNDPEIKRPITDLGMVDSVEIDDAGGVDVTVLLTVAGCPLKDTINRDVTAAVAAVDGISDVRLTLGVMTDEQRAGLKEILSDGKAQREIPFAQPGSLTKVFAIASGKGGVGKSSVTVNLALGMAAQGLKVGVVDADIYGHSVPAMLGVADSRPTQVDDLIMPVPTASGVSVISIGMLKPRRDQVVAWRGPMLDRALVQMLADVYWGDLDVLLLDLPPGTGDIAISLGQHLPGAEVVVVTTPQEAAAEVAERAGRVLGRSLRFEDETREEAWASRRAAYPDAPDWQLEAWVSTYTAIADGSCAEVTGAVEQLTARPARALEETLEETLRA
jgi:ATP-binding protein involved in chromosome partitioning